MHSSLDLQDSEPVAQLRATVSGAVIGPRDAHYDDARAVFYSGFDSRPAAIVRPADATDVARVVTAARDSGLPLAVRSGGHSSAGHSSCDGGLVLDLCSLKALDVDAAGRTAWAQTGLTAGEYTRAVGAHRLATGFGDAPSVGIGGITLGGGVGFLHRRHGLTIDNVLAADVVTADGQLLRTDADSEPDLFWAIRGGGGNFGVVTRFHYRLLDVDDVVGGMLILPATPAVITAFIAEAEAASERMSGMINIMLAPPMPVFPAELHGRLIIMAALVYDGPAADGERAFAPFRALARPVVDSVAPMRYPEVFEGPAGPHPVAMAVRSLFMDSVDRGAADTIIDALQQSTAPMCVTQIRVLGGAVDRVPADATAFAHRGRRLLAAVAAAYNRLEEADQHRAWTAQLADALQQGEPGAYIGFLGNNGADQVRAAYHGPNWDRLRRIKAAYDPTNLFRRNQNIPPAQLTRSQ